MFGLICWNSDIYALRHVRSVTDMAISLLIFARLENQIYPIIFIHSTHIQIYSKQRETVHISYMAYPIITRKKAFSQ